MLRHTFLFLIAAEPSLLAEGRFSNFLAEHIEPEDFTELKWESPDRVITFCEVLYTLPFQDGGASERVKAHISSLLRHSLQEYEKKKELEKMFQLLRLTPELSALTDAHIFRLRNRAYLYEMRRVNRNRRFLYSYLALQVFLAVVAFPLLFIYSENGAIEETIESVAKVELADTQRRHFSYTDGLYWSLITAGTVGYGDITPTTTVGRVLAAIHGVMGVLTTGVIAGLILRWITPRRLDL
jgi:hypothetical protein